MPTSFIYPGENGTMVLLIYFRRRRKRRNKMQCEIVVGVHAIPETSRFFPKVVYDYTINSVAFALN